MGGNSATCYLNTVLVWQNSLRYCHMESEYFLRYCFDLLLSESGQGPIHLLENKLSASISQGTPCAGKGNIQKRQCPELGELPLASLVVSLTMASL